MVMEKTKVIQKCIELFKSLPAVGPKTAERFVYFLLNSPQLLEQIIQGLHQLKTDVVKCKFCNNFSDTDPCQVCNDSTRDSKLLCIVEKPQDVYSIEASGYKGLYYILPSIINPLEGKMPKSVNLEMLVDRIQNVPEVMKPKEIIIATSLTTEGELTSNYIIEFLKSRFNNIKISRIARGLPTGAEIEYADPQTLSFAIKNRISI